MFLRRYRGLVGLIHSPLFLYHASLTGHFIYFFLMSSFDIALTLVRGPGRLLTLAPLLLFFRPASNRDRPATNRDRHAMPWN